MSASARLNRLARSPLVTGNTNEKLPSRTTPVMQRMNRGPITGRNENTSQQKQNGPVNTMQVLTWHEQRLNKLDETLKNLDTSTDNNQVISQLIDTIGILDKKIIDLSTKLDDLRIKNLKVEGEISELTKKQMQTEVKLEVKEANESSLSKDINLPINE